MLVQFKVRNFLSFKDENILDLRSIKAFKEHPTNLIDTGNKEKLIKVASIYGANASGKSNLHLAFSAFQNIIINSLSNVSSGINSDDNSSILKEFYLPFKFDDNKDTSEFEIVMIKDDFEYRYGFEYNSEVIIEEWMYRKSFQTNRTSTIIERDINNIYFGPLIHKECNKYKKLIPNETLILSLFNKLNVVPNIFHEVFMGVMDTLVVNNDFFDNINHNTYSFLLELIDNKKEKEKLLYFLDSIDSGIKDIFYEEMEKEYIFKTIHIGENNKKYEISMNFESQGTIKSILLYIVINTAINNNVSIFIDELNTKLHPLLLKFIIDLFYNEKTKAQLMYTTHDTTLMDKKFFRRDQIFFVQKDKLECSEIVGLSDFKVRSDSSFEKDYLAGVYGGIPMLKDFDF